MLPIQGTAAATYSRKILAFGWNMLPIQRTAAATYSRRHEKEVVGPNVHRMKVQSKKELVGPNVHRMKVQNKKEVVGPNIHRMKVQSTRSLSYGTQQRMNFYQQSTVKFRKRKLLFKNKLRITS